MPIVIYGIDSGNNKIETMTKEQILDAIAQAQEGHSVFDYDDAFISQIKEINHGQQLRFWIGTQAEYNALAEHEINVLYIISDDDSKEEIIEAVENLAESISGVDAALAQKQDVLTFDNAPTENSTNPVTSGGVYLSLNNLINGTVLYICDSSIDSKIYEGDTLTLNQSLNDFDYIEIHTEIAYMVDNIYHSRKSEVKRFKVDNDNNFAFSHVRYEKIQGNNPVTIQEVIFHVEGNILTIDMAETIKYTNYPSGTVTLAQLSTQSGVSKKELFSKIVGIKAT